MMIELRKTHILKGKIAQAVQRFTHRGAVFPDVIEERLNLRSIHQRPSSGFAAKSRIASCITCFKATECEVAIFRQSSYSGAALAISLECQRAILILTGPHCVCTSVKSRASEDLFSSRQCSPIVVVSRKRTSRNEGTRSGLQSTVNCTPVRP